jgi:hypothetical protein
MKIFNKRVFSGWKKRASIHHERICQNNQFRIRQKT